MRCSVLLLIWCVIDSSNQVLTLGFKTGGFNIPRHAWSLDQKSIFQRGNQKEDNRNNQIDSLEEVNRQKVKNYSNQRGFNFFGGFQGIPHSHPHRFYYNGNQIPSSNPHHLRFLPGGLQLFHPFRTSGFLPLRQPGLADGFDPNLHGDFNPSRKHGKLPFIHIGFLPSQIPQRPRENSLTKPMDVDEDIIHSEIHDINNASLDMHDFHDFRYEGSLGPKFWSDLFNTCNGTHQSPVAIYRRNTTHVNYGNFISRNYYTVPDNGTITNNGHTAMVTLTGGATISGGGLPGEFEFLNFHFHWGSDDHRGSEHVLEGVRYPLELHMVHWNLKYKSADEAIQHQDGLAVLAVLFHVEPLGNPYLVPIINALKGVVPSGTNMTFTPNFRLADFLPVDTRDYYRYEGSLTTPECSESVIWTIFANTLSISEGQLDVFRTLLDADNHDRENNHRPVQPLNGRIVYQNGRLSNSLAN